jgi:hypothetical protein
MYDGPHDHPHEHSRPRPGHNAARDAAQWQTPHLPPGHAKEPAAPHERDLDLVEASFVEGFARCSDATIFCG